MMSENNSTPIDMNEEISESLHPELEFDPGELAPCAASPHPDAKLSDEEEKALKALADKIGKIDIAARRWEVEQSWQMRLFDRGYQYLWPRRGGGWIYIPFATDYQKGRSGQAFYGNENNILATYGEILTAALTRDIPSVQFAPQSPSSDADITAKNGATDYARVFRRTQDLQDLHHQLAYYLRVDGRALIVTDHIVDAQQFGRSDPAENNPVVPETEADSNPALMYLVSQGAMDDMEKESEENPQEQEVDDKTQREIQRAASWLKDKGIKQIISSPDDEAMQNADMLSQSLGVPMEADDRLMQTTSDPEDVQDFMDETAGEPPEEFMNRVQQAILELSTAPGPVLLVVSDDVITQVFKMLQGEDIPGAQTEPGWIVSLVANGDGTLTPAVVYPVMPPEDNQGQQRGAPRGQEVAKVYGKLEHKVPFSAGSGKLEDCLWAQVADEADVAMYKAMYPEHEDKIKVGGTGGGGENELDRIARINCNLALEASYVTGDSMVRDSTRRRVWMRPGYFMDIENKMLRQSIMEKFPDGAMVTLVADAFIKARNESMDDHLTLIHAFPGSGMNRMALCSKLLSVQKRLNNWMDLIDMYFVKCVPMRYMASGPFDVDAISKQGTVVGGYVPFLLDKVPAGRSVSDLIWMEPFPQAQPILGDFIKFFVNELPQLLSHALPTLFGAFSNQDTATGVVVQRDQALGSLGSPWHNIRVATASYFRQAVQLAARCRRDPIESMDTKNVKVRIELADLKGNVLCYPEENPNFPETSSQKETRWRELLKEANNAVFNQMMEYLPNRIKAIQALRLEGIKDPSEDNWEKQMGEFEVLLQSGPVPNPDYIKAEQLFQQAKAHMNMEQQSRIVSDQEVQQLAQMDQMLQSMPQQISSVPIKDTDDHAVEAACCMDKINSPAGRMLANGTPAERASFDNLTLHLKEHQAKIPPKTELKDFPRGIAANIKDMPPDAVATLLSVSGLETAGKDVVTSEEFKTELKKSSKVGGGNVPGMAPKP